MHVKHALYQAELTTLWRRRPDSNRGIRDLQSLALSAWLRRHVHYRGPPREGQCPQALKQGREAAEALYQEVPPKVNGQK